MNWCIAMYFKKYANTVQFWDKKYSLFSIQCWETIFSGDHNHVKHLFKKCDDKSDQVLWYFSESVTNLWNLLIQNNQINKNKNVGCSAALKQKRLKATLWCRIMSAAAFQEMSRFPNFPDVTLTPEGMVYSQQRSANKKNQEI